MKFFCSVYKKMLSCLDQARLLPYEMAWQVIDTFPTETGSLAMTYWRAGPPLFLKQIGFKFLLVSMIIYLLLPFYTSAFSFLKKKTFAPASTLEKLQSPF